MTIDAVLSGEDRWCVINADCRSVVLPDASVDHVVCDAPYSRHTHAGMRGNRGAGIVTRDPGFGHLTPELRRWIARMSCRAARGWIAIFSDWESTWLWRLSIEAAGGSYRRVIPWIRWSSPQFNGQAPPTGSEAIVVSKPKSHRRPWLNGGRTHYNTLCLRSANKVAGHTTEKPEGLMLGILSDFAKSGDIIVDWTCGGGATLVAALRLGMRAIGIEKDAKWADVARERCEAEGAYSTLSAARQGQRSLFEDT